MKHHSNVGMMGPKVKFPDGTLQLTCMERLSLWNTLCRALALDRYMPRSRIFAKYKMSYWSYDEIREVDVINGCFWLLSREAINVVGMLDERFFIYGEDIDWAIRFNNAGFKVVYYPNAEIIHYGGGSSANAPVRFYVEMNKANYELWKKYNKNYTHIIYAIIICMHQLLRILGYGVLKYVNNSLRNEYEYKIKRCVACIKWLFAELTGVNDNQIKA